MSEKGPNPPPKKNAKAKEFSAFPAMIFADGASSGNPGPGGWGVILVTAEGQVRELGGGAPDTTNNRMELTATLRGLIAAESIPGPLAIHTDSVYVIRGITQWCWGWMKRGWKTAEGTDVSNTDLWKKLITEVSRRGREHPLDWRFVRGHAGIPGNERVDEIAVSYSKGRPIELYDGPLTRYSVPVYDLPDSFALPEMKAKGEAKAAAYSYLSLVNGVAQRHPDWKSCEARVKGRPGARFKKAMSAADEAEILASWGASLS